MEITVKTPDTKDIEVIARSIQARAAALQIVDDATRIEAGELLKEINAKLKLVEPILEEPVKIAHGGWKEVLAWADKYLNPFKDSKRVIQDKIGKDAYDQEMKRRKEKEIEDAKAIKKAQVERQAALDAAKKAKDKETIQELKQAPLIVNPAPIKTQEAVKAQGVSVRMEWAFEITNPDMVERRFCVPDPVKIRNHVRSLGKNASMPGIRVYEKPITSGRV